MCRKSTFFSGVMLKLRLFAVLIATVHASMFKPRISKDPLTTEEASFRAFRPLGAIEKALKEGMRETPSLCMEVDELVKPAKMAAATKALPLKKAQSALVSFQAALCESEDGSDPSDDSFEFDLPRMREAEEAFVSLVEVEKAQIREQIEKATRRRDAARRHGDTAFQGFPTPTQQYRLRRRALSESDEDPEVAGLGCSDEELDRVFRGMKVQELPVKVVVDTPVSVAEFELNDKRSRRFK